MRPEAAFLAGYSLALTFVAVGLESLGRRSTDPWSSPTLAAAQRPARGPSREGPHWLHSEVPAFHLGISAVALAAAFVIAALSAFRYPGPAELVTHGALLVVITFRIRHLHIRHQALTRREERPHDGVRARNPDDVP